MAFDFPNSPTVGQIATGPGGQSYQFDGSKWVILGGTTPGWIVISDTVPTNPAVGQFWLDSLGMQVYVYYQDPSSAQWIPVSNQPISRTFGNPNKLLNPFMEIDQANEGAGIGLANGQALYAVDGFRGVFTTSGGASTASIGRSPTGTAPPGYTYSATLAMGGTGASSVGAGDFFRMDSLLEGDDLYDLAWGTSGAQSVTLSFWVLASIANTYYVSIRNGAANRSYVAPFTVSTANVWQNFTITIPGDTGGAWTLYGNALQMYVTWAAACGTTYQAPSANVWQAGNFMSITGASNTFLLTASAIFRLGPCKLEVGPSATPMLRQSFQAELQRCQRYYEKSYTIGTAVGAGTSSDAFWTDWYSPAYAASSIQMGQSFYYKVPKRAIPTLSLYSPVTGASGKLRDAGANADVNGTIWVNGTNSFGWYGTLAAASNNGLLYGHMVADARL